MSKHVITFVGSVVANIEKNAVCIFDMSFWKDKSFTRELAELVGVSDISVSAVLAGTILRNGTDPYLIWREEHTLKGIQLSIGELNTYQIWICDNCDGVQEIIDYMDKHKIIKNAYVHSIGKDYGSSLEKNDFDDLDKLSGVVQGLYDDNKILEVSYYHLIALIQTEKMLRVWRSRI